MNRYAGHTGASGAPDDREYGAMQALVVLLDLTKKPTTNDRELKLGNFVGARGIAAAKFNRESLAVTHVDGYHGRDVTSYMLFEPDNWVPRLHTEGGKGLDNVWAIRGIVDHENRECERTHRSMMWIDQCKSQGWAFSMDLMWIIDLGAKVDHEELEFNGAGSLAMFLGGNDAQQDVTITVQEGQAPIIPQSGSSLGVTSFLQGVKIPKQKATLKKKKIKKESGNKKLAALALNVSKTGGYYTDGGKVAQLDHILTFGERVEGPPPTPTSGSTVASPGGGGPGSTTAGAVCRPPDKWSGAIRGDVEFDFGGKLAHIAIHPPNKKPQKHDGDIINGHIYIDDPHAMGPASPAVEDPKSCQKAIPRKLHQGLHVWTALPSYLSSAHFPSVVISYACSWATSYGPEKAPKHQYPPLIPASGSTAPIDRSQNPKPGVASVDLGDDAQVADTSVTMNPQDPQEGPPVETPAGGGYGDFP